MTKYRIQFVFIRQTSYHCRQHHLYVLNVERRYMVFHKISQFTISMIERMRMQQLRTRIRRVFAATVSIALAAAFGVGTAQAVEPNDEQPTTMLTVKVERTDDNGDHAYAGDVLRYTFTYTNTSTHPLTAFPAEGNLDGMLTTGAPNCRYANLPAGQTKQCTTATHRVTQEDVDAGGFTAKTVWKATADRNGTQVLQDNITVNAPTVATQPGERPLEPDAATQPTERADGEAVRLATAGQHGVSCYRIPAIAEAPNGWILAAYDARPNSCQDAPQANSIVQRISKDGGKSFETRTVVAAGKDGVGKYGFSDPSYVVDEETGDIFLFSVKSYDQGWGGSVAGVDPNNRNVLQASVVKSSDNGATWSEPRIITDQITNDVEHWTSRFAASGHGIQLKYGEHAGRLIQQYTINNAGVHQAVSVYSDDHGATWHVGTPVGEHMDENKVVELSDGRVMLNSRPYGSRYRQIAISDDGGQTYGEVYEDTQLPDPANNAQITRAFPNAAEGTPAAKILLYSSSSGDGRHNGLIRISFDDGTTWSEGKLFKEGAMAYSTITALDSRAGGGYGLLYEGDNLDIMYTRISLDWLGYLSATANGEVSVPEGSQFAEVPLDVDNFGKVAYEKLTVTPQPPAGWMAAPIADVAVPAGTQGKTTLRVALPTDAKAGDSVQIPVAISDGEHDGVTGIATVKVTEKAKEPTQDPSDQPTQPEQPSQPAQSGGQATGSNPSSKSSTPAQKETGKPAQAQKSEPKVGVLATTGSEVGLIAVAVIAVIAGAVALLAKRKSMEE